MKFRNILIVLLLAALSAVSATVASGRQPNTSQIVMERHESAPAMTALTAMYAPAENKEYWVSLVCSGMTEGGCAYFEKELADALWESQANHDASFAGFIAGDATIINATKQVWKTSLVIFNDEREMTSDVFLLVEHGEDGFWYLDRVLYGPGISQ